MRRWLAARQCRRDGGRATGPLWPLARERRKCVTAIAIGGIRETPPKRGNAQACSEKCAADQRLGGAARRTRTSDPLITNEVLYQLS